MPLISVTMQPTASPARDAGESGSTRVIPMPCAPANLSKPTPRPKSSRFSDGSPDVGPVVTGEGSVGRAGWRGTRAESGVASASSASSVGKKNRALGVSASLR